MSDFCTACGTRLEGASACPSCGAAIPTWVATELQPAEQELLTAEIPVMAADDEPGSEPAAQERRRRLGRRTPSTGRPRRWRRRVLIGGIALVLIGVLSAGVGSGYLLFDRFTDPSAGPVEVRVVNASEVAAEEPELTADDLRVTMPDILGLTKDESTEALFDSGVDLTKVTYEQVAYVGEPGVVVQQSPPRGTVDPTTLVITLSKAANVPALAGTKTDAAIRALEAMGTIVTVVEEFVPGAAEGTVVSSSPAAGSPLTEEVELRVAAPPASVFLDAIEPVDSSCSATSGGDPQSINGTAHEHAITCSASSEEGTTADYNLGRGITQVTATVGISDAEQLEGRARIEILGDGVVLFTKVMAFGQSTPVTVDVSNRLRLTLRVVSVEPPNECCPSYVAVFGSPRLLGSPAAINKIAA